MEFDYVIFGSGAAGSTLSNELSKDNKSTIAIIDIGKTRKPNKKRQFKAPFLNQCTRSYTHSISGVFGGVQNYGPTRFICLLKERLVAGLLAIKTY